MGVSDWFFVKGPRNAVLLEAPTLPFSTERRKSSVVFPSKLSADSVRTTSSNTTAGLGIRHEMVVAYLYQQQCSNAWISDTKSDTEGALMRTSWDNYVTCPEALAQTPLTKACAILNVHVSILTIPHEV